MSIIKKICAKLFLSPYFFTIAIRKKTSDAIVDKPEFKAEYLMPARRTRWAADPMLIDYEGKTYLFYEAVIADKGRIEVAEVLDDCSTTSPVVILEDECHYSYPFVFQMDSMWYMIPESSASNEVRIYKAEEFPYKWEKEAVLLYQKSVDSTVFNYDGTWYLQTYCICPNSEKVFPQIFTVDFSKSQPAMSQLPWPAYDPLLCRGAGPWFKYNGALFRPAQENEDQRYGNAVRFYRLDSLYPEFRETTTAQLTAENVSANVWLDGLHTYTSSKYFEAIDIRIRKFDAFKVFRVIGNKFKKALF